MLATPASEATTAEWLTAWATLGAAVAAVVAGVFAWRAWRASAATLDNASRQLAIEQERLAAERAERDTRALATASQLTVRDSSDDSGDGSTEIIVENRAAVPFASVELIVAEWVDGLSRAVAYSGSPWWADSMEPHGEPMRTGPLPVGRSWYWELYYSDVEGRNWHKRERDGYMATPSTWDEPSEIEFPSGWNGPPHRDA